jgi:hypothetical protein
MSLGDVLQSLKIVKEADLQGETLKGALLDLAGDLMRLAQGGEGDTFADLLDRMLIIHLEKNADYGNSFGLAPNLLGIPAHVGLLSRMTDKLARACRISQREARVKDESLRDTLLDLANYALLTILALPGEGRAAGD